MFNKDNFSNRRFTPVKVLTMVLLFVALASVLTTLVMILWNAILPDLVGVKPISFWKAAGLLLLFKILIGGLGKLKPRNGRSKSKSMMHKWMQMSHEERHEAKTRWKEHCKNKKAESKNEE